MKRMLMFWMLAGMAVYAPATAWAFPQQINYQGYLTRPDGTALDTTVAMTFRIWNTDGSILMWSETQGAVPVIGGIFNVRLGQYTPIPESAVSAVVQMLLGIAVGNDSEMTPRVPLTSVPYARRVNTVDEAGGGTITGKLNVGWGNTNSGDSSFVTGYINHANGTFSTISGGWMNTASGYNSTIGGGFINVAANYGTTVAGGHNNTAFHNYATVGGGFTNDADGGYATIPGGRRNSANGDLSFAAGDSCIAAGARSFTLGTRITCSADSAFVWSDGSGPVTSIGSSRTFSVKATGGTRIWTNSTLTSGVTIGAGGNAWVQVSDSTKKRHIRGLDTRDILDRFSSLPLKRWEYNSEEPGVEHIGPMAQDFWNAFHLGNEPLGISTIDADGVMMAAIHELKKKTDEIEELKARITKLEAALGASASVIKKGN